MIRWLWQRFVQSSNKKPDCETVVSSAQFSPSRRHTNNQLGAESLVPTRTIGDLRS